MKWHKLLCGFAFASVLLHGCMAEPEPAALGGATAVSTPSLEENTSTTTPETENSSVADADVIYVSAIQADDGTWTFRVTVAHPDTGWEDYADGWDVVLSDGTVLLPIPDEPFTRLLRHPHENEQPFTRSQSNIAIPQDAISVTVRAHDLVDGFGGEEVIVDLTIDSGENFEVNR